MKTLTISALLLTLAIATLSFVTSSNVDTTEMTNTFQHVDAFRAHRQGKNVVLSWNVAGAGISKFAVERSYDGDYFENIETIENIGASTYKFKDELVPPGYLYYRIRCMDDQENELSKSNVEVIRIVQRK